MVCTVSSPEEGAPTAVPPATKKMRLRYAGRCRSCGTDLPPGTPAFYQRDSRTVTCLACAAPATDLVLVGDAAPAAPPVAPQEATSTVPLPEPEPEPEPEAPGVAGASARREFERRRANREQRIRSKHPHLGGLILAVSDDPQSTKAWAVGACGEETLGRRLDGLATPTVRVLHDRRIPRTRANIDHIIICAAGVLVVDAKQYKGRPHLRVEGGLFVPRTEKLLVGSRDGSKLVDGVLKQVDLVRSVVDEEAIQVRGYLCFVDADWPLFGGSFATRGVTALWPKKLAAVIAEPGPLTEDEIRALHGRLAKAFAVA